jgi:hypothetical protein
VLSTLHDILFQIVERSVEEMDYSPSRFFWQGDSDKKKYRLAMWNIVYRPKDQRGLGIHDILIKNSALLGKWLFRLLTKNMIWQTLLKKKYIGSKEVS